MILKTKKKKEADAVYKKLYADFIKLYVPGAMKMPIYEHLAKKYGFHPTYVAKKVREMGKEACNE